MRTFTASLALAITITATAPRPAGAAEPPGRQQPASPAAPADSASATTGEPTTPDDLTVEKWPDARLVLPPISLEARSAYEDRLIQIDTIGPRPHGTIGVTRQPLTGGALYRALGRDDLAEAYERRSFARDLLRWGGAGFAIAGIAYIPLDDTFFPPDRCLSTTTPASRQACLDQQVADHRLRLRVAVGLAVFSLAMAVYAQYYLNPHPIDSRQAARLAREHNRRVRLGGVDDTAWHLAPTVGEDGGGISITGVF